MGAWSTAWRFSNSNVMILHADAFGKGPCELWTRKLEWWKKSLLCTNIGLVRHLFLSSSTLYSRAEEFQLLTKCIELRAMVYLPTYIGK